MVWPEPQPCFRGVDDRVDQQHQAAGEQHGAGQVGALLEPDAGPILDHAQRVEPGRDPDRQVHEEDPVPVQRLGEHAAEEEADRAARDGCERVHADRLRLLARLREHRHDHPEDHGGGERAAHALHEAGADEHALALCDRAQERCAREHREPGEEHAPLADQVAEPAGEQQQAAEGDQVGVDDPGEVALGEAQVVLDRRERDVHDRRVEDDHQHPDAEDVEGGPALAIFSHASDT